MQWSETDLEPQTNLPGRAGELLLSADGLIQRVRRSPLLRHVEDVISVPEPLLGADEIDAVRCCRITLGVAPGRTSHPRIRQSLTQDDDPSEAVRRICARLIRQIEA